MDTLSETITSTVLIHTGRVFDLHRHTVTLPNGSESVRDIITHPGAVAVLPIHAGSHGTGRVAG
jgi:ADP-ribose pyrophosphatase